MGASRPASRAAAGPGWGHHCDPKEGRKGRQASRGLRLQLSLPLTWGAGGQQALYPKSAASSAHGCPGRVQNIQLLAWKAALPPEPENVLPEKLGPASHTWPPTPGLSHLASHTWPPTRGLPCLASSPDTCSLRPWPLPHSDSHPTLTSTSVDDPFGACVTLLEQALPFALCCPWLGPWRGQHTGQGHAAHELASSCEVGWGLTLPPVLVPVHSSGN